MTRVRGACKAAIRVNQLNKTWGYKKGRGISGNTKRSLQYWLVLRPTTSDSNYVMLRRVAETKRREALEVKYGFRTESYSFFCISKYTHSSLFGGFALCGFAILGVALRMKIKKIPKLSRTF